MKSVFYSKDKAEEQKVKKTESLIEQERRNIYFQRLKKDRAFRKYILEDIIDNEIQINKDISSSLASFITATPEEVKSIIVGKSGALKSAENIKNRIVMNF